MAAVLQDPEVVNQYYAEFWNSEAWGSAEPNVDERLRANAIVSFIEKFVIPQEAGISNLKILDLGCGRGWLTTLLSAYGPVIGIDPVPSAIERAKVLFPRLNVRVAEGRDLIAEGLEGQFDLIVSSEVIEHVVNSQKKKFLSDVYRLLKPGGFAILTTPRGELWKIWSREVPDTQPVEEWISEVDLQRLCESVNLRVVTKDRVFLTEFPFDWLSRVAARKSRLLSAFGPIDLQSRLRHYRAIYQAILLVREQ